MAIKMNITGITILRMNAMKAALKTHTVNTVSVNAAMDIRRNGAVVKVSGGQIQLFNKSSSDQTHLIHSNPATLQWSA